MPEKTVAEQIKETWEQMKAKNDEILAESKKTGITLGENKAVLDKMHTRLDELELKLQRQALTPVQITDRKPLDEKAIAGRKAFFNFMRHGKTEMDTLERKALVEDSTGEILVPEDLDAEITRSLPKISVMRNLAGVRNTTRDRVRRRSMTEVTVGWGKLETGTPIVESNSTPSEAYMYVEDLYGLTKIGEDELQDSDVNLESLIADSFSRAIAEAEDTAFAIGTGHTYSQPDGIAVDSNLLLAVGGGAAHVHDYCRNWAVDDTVDTAAVLGAEYALPPQYLQGASFLMNRKTELALRLLRAEVAAGYYGNYLWQPSLLAGMPNSFDGFPIYNQADMNYPADASHVVDLVFGNFKAGYRIVDRAGMTIQRLNELYAEDGLVGFRCKFRVGGGVLRIAAFQAISNDT